MPRGTPPRASGKFARPGGVRADDDAAYRIEVRLGAEAGEFHIAEAMKSEARLPDFHAFPFAGVVIRGGGLAQVLRVNRTIRFEHFGVTQGDRGSAPVAASHPLLGAALTGRAAGAGHCARLTPRFLQHTTGATPR